jgi:CRP-like cAMP-binding protein
MGSDPISSRRAIFDGHVLFGALTPAERDALLAYARTKSFRAREAIFHKGSPGTGMMAVLKGRVRISAMGQDGKEVVLNVIEEGGIFGEIALLDGKDRTADAKAMTDCELLILDRREFLPFLKSHPDVSLRLLTILCDRLRRTTEQVEDMLFLDLPARLAKALLRLAETHGRRSGRGLRIEAKLSQRELGQWIGQSRESVNKQLAAWQEADLIALEAGSIVILDEAGLRAAVETA